jgi:hypothetical protein
MVSIMDFQIITVVQLAWNAHIINFICSKYNIDSPVSFNIKINIEILDIYNDVFSII